LGCSQLNQKEGEAMRKQCLLFVATLCVLFAAEGSALAQSERPTRKELLEASVEPELFGSQARYLMGAGTPTIIVSENCDEVFTFPDEVCIQADPTHGGFGQGDLGHVMLPGNSAKNGIMFVGTSFSSSRLTNFTDSPLDTVEFTAIPQIDIESDALKDPRAVDAGGNPLNGVFGFVAVAPRCQIRKSMAPHESFEQTCWGASRVVVLSKTVLTNSGLPADIVDRMFRGPITLRLRLTGRLRSVSRGNVIFTVRVFGL
jgi:hypothetical protein